MSNQPFIQFGPFKGINNVDNVRNLDSGDLAQAQNVDIDNTRRVVIRQGYDDVASGNCHSLWSNKAKTICLFVEGTELKRLNKDWSKTAIRTGLTSGLRMSYNEINDQIWYSNGEILGCIENFADKILLTPSEVFKSPMLPGDISAFYNNRLYTVKGGTVYFSDPMAFHRRDRRFCRLFFAGRITLFKPVSNGIWTAFGGNTYFMSGSEPSEFNLTLKADYDAIPYTAVDIEKALVGDGIQGRAIMWLSEKGVCLGSDSGEFQNLTIKRYKMSSARAGASLYKLKENVGHFISVIHN